MAIRPPLVINAGDKQSLQGGDFCGQINFMVSVKDEPLALDSGDLYLLLAGVLWTDASISVDFPATNYEPDINFNFFDASTTLFDSDPLILDSGILADTGGNPATIVWLNAARCPQVVSTLLVIGI